MLAASLSGAVYTLMARRLLVTRSALFVTTFQNLFGALFMAPLAAVEAAVVGVRTPTTAAVSAVLYLALLGSILAYLLLNYGLRFVAAGRAAAFTNVIPVIAVAAAFVVLGERFTVGQAVAAVVVVAGVFLANRSGSAARSGQPVGVGGAGKVGRTGETTRGTWADRAGSAARGQKSMGRMRSASRAATNFVVSSSKLRRTS